MRRGIQRMTHGIEVLFGAILAVLFFLAVLGILNLMFPDATDLGALVRQTEQEQAEFRVDLDLRGLADPSRSPIAVLSEVVRNVRGKRADSITWSAAEAGESLVDRHAVQTSERSAASITFDRSNRLQLAENSLVIVRRPNRLTDEWTRKASVLFIDGELHGRLDATTEDRMEVEILAAGGAIRHRPDHPQATEFSLRVDQGKEAVLSVFSGEAEILRGGESTVISSGHAAVFDAETSSVRSVALPRPPAILGPAGNRHFLYRTNPPEVDFRWKPQKTTTAYRLTIGRDADLQDVVHDGTSAAPRFVHGNLHEGTYYWQVRSVRGEVESRPSPVGRFRVSLDSHPPPLQIWIEDDDTATRRVTVRGITEPGASVFVGERRAPVRDTGEFELELELRPGYNSVVIQAVDTAGNTTFDSRDINLGSDRRRSL